MIKDNLAQLIIAGFIKSGVWQHSENGEVITIHKTLPDEPGLYAFVVEGRIMYIGSANGLAKRTTLRSRMRSYQRHQRVDRKKSSNRPVHLEIANVHKGKGMVEIYTLVPVLKEPLTWKGLPIDLLIGLEAGLIQHFNPEWNRRGRKPSLELKNVIL